MMSREKWLSLWGHVDGTPEAEAAWNEKQSFDARQTTGPMVISDYIDPVVSHANGRTYDSKSGLFASYLPSGNPQGVRYECIGERVATPYEKPRAGKGEIRSAIQRAIQQVGA